MFTWGSFVSTRQFCYKDIGQASSGCRCLSLLGRVCSRHWTWNPGSASGWSKSKRRDTKTCHTIHHVWAPVWISYPALALDTSCHCLILIQTHIVPHCIRVMAPLLVLTFRQCATLPPPQNCRHHHHHSTPYSFTNTEQARLITKPCLKFCILCLKPRSQAKHLLRPNR